MGGSLGGRGAAGFAGTGASGRRALLVRGGVSGVGGVVGVCHAAVVLGGVGVLDRADGVGDATGSAAMGGLLGLAGGLLSERLLHLGVKGVVVALRTLDLGLVAAEVLLRLRGLGLLLALLVLEVAHLLLELLGQGAHLVDGVGVGVVDLVEVVDAADQVLDAGGAQDDVKRGLGATLVGAPHTVGEDSPLLRKLRGRSVYLLLGLGHLGAGGLECLRRCGEGVLQRGELIAHGLQIRPCLVELGLELRGAGVCPGRCGQKARPCGRHAGGGEKGPSAQVLVGHAISTA